MRSLRNMLRQLSSEELIDRLLYADQVIVDTQRELRLLQAKCIELFERLCSLNEPGIHPETAINISDDEEVVNALDQLFSTD